MHAYPYLIVALVLVMTWTLVLAFELDMRVGALASVVALLALAAFLGWQWFRRARGESPGQTRDTKDPAQDLTHVTSAFAVNIHEASERIKSAHRTLSQLTDSRFHDARYALPWYLIIGPEGAGKSSIVRDSGQTLAYTSLGTKGVTPQEISNTDHLHVWVGDRAVMADTAGRYSSTPSSGEEWNELIKAYRQQRPNQGLEALVIAIGIDTLKSMNPTELTELGERLRRQAQQVNAILGSNHPLYLLLTKADHLPGFHSFAHRLDSQEQHRPWGWTWPQHQAGLDLEVQANNGFKELCHMLHERCMQEVMRETEVPLAEELHRFSRGLSRLRTSLLTIVSALGVQSLGHDRLQIRGIHLSAQGQAKIPNTGVSPFTKTFDGTLATVSHLLPTGSPLFLRSYLSEILLPDQGLAQPGPRARRFKRRRDGAIAVGGLVGALSFCTLPLLSARNNRDLQHEVKTLVRKVHAAKATPAGQAGAIPEASWYQSALLDARLQGIEDDTEFRYRFGMYQGKALHSATKSLFLGLTLEYGVQPLARQDQAVLRALAQQQQRLSSLQVQALRDSLFRYLLLSSPDASPQPPIEGAVQERLVNLISAQWVQDLRFSSHDRAQTVANRFIELLKIDPSLATPRDAQLVANARARLLRDDPMLADADALIQSFNQGRPPILLKDLVDSRVMTNGGHAIRAAYTRRAWEHTIKKGLDEAIDRYSEDDWILGLAQEDPSSQRAERKSRLYDHYLRAFQKEWQAFLETIDVVTPSYEEEFISVLDSLSHRGNSPLYALANAVDWNTQLQSKLQGGLQKAKDVALNRAQALSPAVKQIADKAQAVALNQKDGERQRYMSVEQLQAHFAPFVRFGIAQRVQPPAGTSVPVNSASATPPTNGPGPDLNRYLELVRSLRNNLSEASHDRGNRSARQRTISNLATQVQSLAHEQNAAWRTWFERVLYAPFHFARTTQQSQQERLVETAWCDLARTLKSKVFNRYPFQPSATLDVDLVELGELLHPKTGALWRLQTQTFGDLIENNGLRFKRSSGKAKRLRPADRRVISFYNAAASLAQALYPPGQKRPEFAFKVEAKPQSGIQRSEFTLNDQKYAYANGSEHSQTMTWPSKDLEQRARIVARHASGELRVEEPGTWGLFRLMEGGRVRSASHATSIVVSWDINPEEGQSATLHFTPLRNPSPMSSGKHGRFMSLFRDPALKVPGGFLVGSPRCK